MKFSKRTFWILFAAFMLFIVPTVLAQGEEPPIQIGEISAARVIAFLAAGMSILFDYFPGVAKWYEGLEQTAKQLLAVGLAVVVVGGAFALTCASVISTSLVCSGSGAWDALTGIIYVIVLQYGFHKATKPSDALKVTIGVLPATKKGR